LPCGQGAAAGAEEDGQGWQGPPCAFERGEPVFVLVELLVVLVVALGEQVEAAVEAGES
jgi:hypothetical protein